MNKKPTNIIKATEEDDLDIWSLPKVQTELTTEQESQTNALGQKENWQYEPPEEDIIAPEPLTAEDIEAIRQAAHEEGFTQGKEEGFTTGYEEGKAQGLTDGKAQGLTEGTAKGMEEGKDAIDSLSEKWSSLIEQLNKPLASVEKNIEDQLLNLVVQLTEAVVLQEAKINPDILIAAIAAGIKTLPSNEENTQIYLHPDDIKHVEQQFGEHHIKESGWKLLPAPQLTPGSCQIENSTSNIDLQMKSRLKQVLESFLQDALHQ